MARETLEAVKQTEINATKIESQANNKHDEIIFRAGEKAGTIINTKEKEALKSADDEMEKAKRLGDEIVKNSIIEGNEEKENLIKTAENNEKAAIGIILSQII